MYLRSSQLHLLRYAWIASFAAAALGWAVYWLMQPAREADLGAIRGEVTYISYSYSGKSSRQTRQSLELRLAGGATRSITVPRFDGNRPYRAGVDVRYGDVLDIKISAYDNAYEVKSYGRILMSYEQARQAYLPRLLVPGFLATLFTLLGLLLGALTCAWPQLRAALRLAD